MTGTPGLGPLRHAIAGPTHSLITWTNMALTKSVTQASLIALHINSSQMRGCINCQVWFSMHCLSGSHSPPHSFSSPSWLSLYHSPPHSLSSPSWLSLYHSPPHSSSLLSQLAELISLSSPFSLLSQLAELISLSSPFSLLSQLAELILSEYDPTISDIGDGSSERDLMPQFTGAKMQKAKLPGKANSLSESTRYNRQWFTHACSINLDLRSVFNVDLNCLSTITLFAEIYNWCILLKISSTRWRLVLKSAVVFKWQLGPKSSVLLYQIILLLITFRYL